MPAETTSASTIACCVGPNPWASTPRQKTPALSQPSWLFPFAVTQTSCGNPGAVEITNDHTGAVGGSATTRGGIGRTASTAANPSTRPVLHTRQVRLAHMTHLHDQRRDSPA